MTVLAVKCLCDSQIVLVWLSSWETEQKQLSWKCAMESTLSAVNPQKCSYWLWIYVPKWMYKQCYWLIWDHDAVNTVILSILTEQDTQPGEVFSLPVDIVLTTNLYTYVMRFIHNRSAKQDIESIVHGTQRIHSDSVENTKPNGLNKT